MPIGQLHAARVGNLLHRRVSGSVDFRIFCLFVDDDFKFFASAEQGMHFSSGIFFTTPKEENGFTKRALIFVLTYFHTVDYFPSGFFLSSRVKRGFLCRIFVTVNKFFYFLFLVNGFLVQKCLIGQFEEDIGSPFVQLFWLD